MIKEPSTLWYSNIIWQHLTIFFMFTWWISKFQIYVSKRLNSNAGFLKTCAGRLLDMRNLQEQGKKAFCCQKLFRLFTVWINCSDDLKNFTYSSPSATNFKCFSRSLEQFFLTVGQNNCGNKIPLWYSTNSRNIL